MAASRREPAAVAVRDHVAAGLRHGLVAGALLGGVLAAALLALPTIGLVLAGAPARAWAALLLVAGTAAAFALAASPLAVLVGLASSRLPRGWTLLPSAFYRTGAWVVCAVLPLELALGFAWLRDPRKPSALALEAAVALAPAVAALAAGLRRATAARQRAAGLRSGGVGVALALGLAAAAYLELAGQPSLGREPAPWTPVALAQPARAQRLTRDHPLRVLLVSIDTLRADHLGIAGGRPGVTPELDRLAREGVFFRRAHSVAPWTLPSHASIFTSLYPSQHGARFSSQHTPVIDVLDPRNLTLAEVLRDAGLSTAAIVSAPWLTERWEMTQGFEDHTLVDPDSLSSAKIVDRALAWLAGHGDRSFFLFLHFFDVHNYDAPPEVIRRYVDPDYAGPLRGRIDVSRNAHRYLSPDDLDYLRARYDAALHHVDHELGRLFAFLRERGLTASTLIVVTADHGEEFWEHGGTGHGFTLYEEQLRVPLILKPPSGALVRVHAVDETVSTLDIFPTVLDYLGLPPLKGLEGRSLRPLVEGESLPPRRLFAEDTYFMNRCAVIEGRFKFIENRIPPDRLLDPRMLFVNLRAFFKFRGPELYALDRDPGEKRNLIRSERAVAERLGRLVLRHVRVANRGEQRRADEATLEKLRALGYVQ